MSIFEIIDLSYPHIVAAMVLDAAGSMQICPVSLFHPSILRAWSTCMALASCPARQGQQRSLRRMRQLLSWALARSPGARSWAWARLAAFCEAGLFRLWYGVRT